MERRQLILGESFLGKVLPLHQRGLPQIEHFEGGSHLFDLVIVFSTEELPVNIN